jgi:serine/threonine protein kinase
MNRFIEARQQPGGANLSLKRSLGVTIWWQWRGGLTLNRLNGHIRTLIRLEDTPNYIVIHIAGNDIGNVRVGYLLYLLVNFMPWLSHEMPNTEIIWSQILPRKTWRYSNNTKSMEDCRRKLNSSLGRYMVRHDDYYIKYPDIKPDNIFISSDGVHLTKLGNIIFLNTLQGALEYFVTSKSGGLTFPDRY